MNWTAETFGAAAFVLNVAGNWMLTGRHQNGWLVRIASNAAQIAYAFLMPSVSLGLNGATFLAINVIGFRRWRLIEQGHDDNCRARFWRVCNCGRLA